MDARGRSFVVMMVMVTPSGCTALNPAFLPGLAGATDDAGESGDTPTAPLESAGDATSDDSSGRTSGDSSGPATDTATDATTGALDGTTTADVSTGEGVDASSGGTTGAAPEPILVRHYEPDGCTKPLWCYNGAVGNGVPGTMRGAECFDAPVAPPFRVRSIDAVIHSVAGAPKLTFHVWAADADGPTVLLHSSPAQPAVAGATTYAIPAEQQPLVSTDRFCVGFTGGDLLSKLGVAADEAAPPPTARSFFDSQACGPGQLIDVGLLGPEKFDPFGAWCLGAELLGEP